MEYNPFIQGRIPWVAIKMSENLGHPPQLILLLISQLCRKELQGEWNMQKLWAATLTASAATRAAEFKLEIAMGF